MNPINPLVSVVVNSYNSASTIIETLESIFSQTYENIELIITDDFSTDDTLGLCNHWIQKQNVRFKRATVLQYSKNTGIASNINRGMRASRGKWIKLIAADDILLPDCITDYTNYINNNPEVRIVQSSSIYYKEKFSADCFMYLRNVSTEPLAKIYDSRYQYHVLLWAPSVNAPSVFLNADLIRELDYFDEHIAIFEDWPMWLKISKAGFSIHSLEKPTVCYRVNANSISNQGIDEKIYSNFYIKLYQYQKEHLFDKMNSFDVLLKRYEYIVYSTIDALKMNRNIFTLKLLYFALMVPFKIYEKARHYNLRERY
jgi:glycosyltransferase involved in cell wall biosynthesis